MDSNPPTNPDPCPLCHKDAKFEGEQYLSGHDRYLRYNCHLCGNFKIGEGVLGEDRFRDKPHPYLSAASRKARSGQLVISLDNWKGLEEAQQSTRIDERMNDLLRLVGERSDGPGGSCQIRPAEDYPLIAAGSPQELKSYLAHLQNKGYIAYSDVRPPAVISCQLTIPGWQELEPMPHPGGIPGRCFIAMWFDPSVNDALEIGIKPAIRDCGFDPKCLDGVPTNEGITDRILSEIRLAEFVVADFTGDRGGVYFEAGFARGLGREVIWTCRKDYLSNVHFDIKHYGYVVWETPVDLRTKLAESIRANIIPKR